MRKKHFNPRRNINREVMEVIADKALDRIEQLESEVIQLREQLVTKQISSTPCHPWVLEKHRKKMKKKGKMK